MKHHMITIPETGIWYINNVARRFHKGEHVIVPYEPDVKLSGSNIVGHWVNGTDFLNQQRKRTVNNTPKFELIDAKRVQDMPKGYKGSVCWCDGDGNKRMEGWSNNGYKGDEEFFDPRYNPSLMWGTGFKEVKPRYVALHSIKGCYGVIDQNASTDRWVADFIPTLSQAERICEIFNETP